MCDWAADCFCELLCWSVRAEVLTAVLLKIRIFQDVMLCRASNYCSSSSSSYYYYYYFVLLHSPNDTVSRPTGFEFSYRLGSESY
jgi:hypothetical protein